MNFKPVLGPGMSSKGRTRSSTFAESSKSSRLSKVIACVFCDFQTATKGLRFCARCRRFLRRAMLEEYISDSSDQTASAGDRPSLLCKFSKYWQGPLSSFLRGRKGEDPGNEFECHALPIVVFPRLQLSN